MTTSSLNMTAFLTLKNSDTIKNASAKRQPEVFLFTTKNLTQKWLIKVTAEVIWSKRKSNLVLA